MAESRSPFNPDGLAATVLLATLFVLVLPVGFKVAAQWERTPVWWNVLILAGLTVTLVMANQARRRSVLPSLAARWLIATVIAALISQPLLGDASSTERPWALTLVPTAAMACSVATLVVSVDLLLALSLALGVLWTRVSQLWIAPTSIVVGDVLFVFASVTLTLALLQVFRAAASSVALAQEDASRQFALSRRAQSASQAAALWDAYLHDEVISRLTEIAHATEVDRVHQLATELIEATESMSGPALPAPAIGTNITEITLRQYPAARATIQIDDDACPVPAETLLAMIDALSEGLANVRQHAYPAGVTGPASIDLRHSADAITATLSDSGVGFDLGATDPTCLGVDLAILGRMEAVGGTAQIQSTPGHGTVVTLQWRPPASSGSQ